jgi:hypothetical protein
MSECGDSPWLECDVGGSTIMMLIDSGADINAIGSCDWERIARDYERGASHVTDLRDGNAKKSVSAYATATPLLIVKAFSAEIAATGNPERKIQAHFFVVEGATKSLLGRDSARRLGVLKFGLGVNVCVARPLGAGEEAIFPSVP